MLAVGATTVHAQKIVCWKNKSGKVIGCGDRVPPEFRMNESKTLDRHGLTRGITVSAEEAARLREEKKKNAALKAEEDRRITEQRRQDTVLINTYASTEEIDMRRDREIQVIDLQITQLRGSLKSATDAQATVQKRHDGIVTSGRPVPDSVQNALKRFTSQKERVETRIAEKEKGKEVIRARYAAQKARFAQLKSGAVQRGVPSAAATAPKR